MNRITPGGIAALLLIACAAAHPADALPRAGKKLDAYFDSLQQQGLVSGSFAVSERGTTRYRRSIGFAKFENGVPEPADDGTRYRIGAVTRMFTAALTMQLAEGGSITLDNKVAEFFPDVENATAISYRDVMLNRSGLTEDSNYLLLGWMLEKVHDKSYANIVAQRITAKLGLVRTYYKGAGGSTTLESASYHWTPQGWSADPAADKSMVGGAGGMVSNAGDLVSFMDGLLAGRVVSPQSFATMQGEDGNAGFGMRAASIGGVPAIGERGTVESFEAAVYHFPAQRLTVAWTGNASRMPLDDILGEVVRILTRAK